MADYNSMIPRNLGGSLAADFGSFDEGGNPKDTAGNFMQPPPGIDPMSWRVALTQQQQRNANPAQFDAQQQQQAAERNAYGVSRDAALGMMMPGSIGANGTDYSKAQPDPSAAQRAFDASGYTQQQALSDGWGTGVGTPGWQSTPQSQHLNPNGGNMAASSPSDPNWGRQLNPSIAQQLGGGQQGQSGSPQQGGIYQQLGAMLGPQGPSSSAPRYGASYGQQQSGGQGGNPYAALTGPLPSSGQQSPQQGGNPFGALSSYLDQRSQGGYGGPSHQPAQLYNTGTPKMVPQSSLQIKPHVLSSIASQLAPPSLYNTGTPQMMQPGSLTIKPGVLSAIGSQLGTPQTVGGAPRTASATPYAGLSNLKV